MPEIHINPSDLDAIVKSYKEKNDKFIFRSFPDNETRRTCTCYINSKECKIVFYIKKNCVKIQPIGKNIKEAKMLVDYVASNGYSTKEKTMQFAFPCKNEIVESLIKYIEDECQGLVTCDKEREEKNIYKFTGYNQDYLVFTYFPTKNKALIQGRPFRTYGIVTTYLAGLDFYSIDDIVSFHNEFTGVNTPASIIRKELEQSLEDVYNYLDEALLKCISGSLSSFKNSSISEDYTGYIVGAFKALEGFLKKVLVEKYNYKLTKYNTFSMFYKGKNGSSVIDNDRNIGAKQKKHLIKLNGIYSDKRNVYLHTTIDPSQTRIIPTLKEARDLYDEILKAIKDAYLIIFK